jgi:drug/metabolite transporter (DMT)-like permease
MRRYLPLVLTMVFWGSAFATSKITVDSGIPPATAAALRFAGGAVILLTVVLTTGQTARLDRKTWPMIGLLGLLGVFGYN